LYSTGPIDFGFEIPAEKSVDPKKKLSQKLSGSVFCYGPVFFGQRPASNAVPLLIGAAGSIGRNPFTGSIAAFQVSVVSINK
jgi:hypothetical protein